MIHIQIFYIPAMSPIIYQCYKLILFVVSPHLAQKVTFNWTYNAV